MRTFKEILTGWSRKFEAASVAGAFAEEGEFETARILYNQIGQRQEERPRLSPRPRLRA